MIKKFKDYIKESYKISDDDYRYFKRNFLDDKGKYVEDIKNNRVNWEKMMLATCKSHWDIGDGGEDFPKEDMKKVISEILDDYIKKFDKLDESILPEPVQLDIEDVPHKFFDSDNILIDYEIENIISDELKNTIDKFSFVRKFTEDEILKLNLYFGIYKKQEEWGTYFFNTKYGTFGQPITNIKGFIYKKYIINISKEEKYVIDIDKKELKKTKKFIKENNIEDECFLIDAILNVKAGSKKGGKHIYVIFQTLKEVFKFLDSFKK